MARDEQLLHTPGLAELVGRQWGVVSAAQLRALGLGPHAIERRVRQGWLRRLHRGVYAVGWGPLSFTGRCWAAHLATHGIVSHRAAAALHDVMRAPAGALDVTTLRQAHARPGLRVHRTRSALEVVHRDGVPVTSVDRTLIDLADVLTPHELERVCHRAELLRLDVPAPEPPGRRTRKLHAALATLRTTGPEITRSELEERFLLLTARFGLPRPKVNARVHGYEVDFAWLEPRLVAETDGDAYHSTPRARERDRRRDAELTAAGFEVLRFSWGQVVHTPDTVAAALRARLAYGPSVRAAPSAARRRPVSL